MNKFHADKTYVEQSIVLVLEHIFARLSINGVVEQLEKVLLKVVCRLATQRRVLCDVRFQPARLRELDHGVDFAKDHAMLQVELEIAIMTEVLSLVEQIWDQLHCFCRRLYLIVLKHFLLFLTQFCEFHRQSLGCQRIVTVRIVQMVWIIEVALDEIPSELVIILSEPVNVAIILFVDPAKVAIGQWLAHAPAIQVVCVDVQKILARIFWLERIAHVLVVCNAKSVGNHGHTTPQTVVHHAKHGCVCQQVQATVCEFEHRVPRQMRRADIVRWVQLVLFEASRAKRLKHIGQLKDITLEIEIVIVQKRLTAKRIPHLLRMIIVLHTQNMKAILNMFQHAVHLSMTQTCVMLIHCSGIFHADVMRKTCFNMLCTCP